MSREEDIKNYMNQFEEGSVDIIVNPDGSTIRIPAKKNDVTMDEYGDMHSKIGNDNTIKIVSSYAMIQAYYKMMGHIAKKISKLEDEIDNLKSKQ